MIFSSFFAKKPRILGLFSFHSQFSISSEKFLWKFRVKVVVSDSDIFIRAVESQIRDTDMAKFMVEYARDNILQNAAQAMLAQANQNSQGILSLL